MDELLQELSLILEFARITEETQDYKKEEFLLIQEKEFKERQLLKEIYEPAN